jgi:transposase
MFSLQRHSRLKFWKTLAVINLKMAGYIFQTLEVNSPVRSDYKATITSNRDENCLLQLGVQIDGVVVDDNYAITLSPTKNTETLYILSAENAPDNFNLFPAVTT